MDLEPFLSVVVPLFNEADGLPVFARRLRAVLDDLDVSYEVVFVNDGSVDQTVKVSVELGWAKARIISLASNVGHQAAIDAGLSVARGTYILTMDGDGQHPPELIPELLHTARSLDVDIVYTVQRNRRADSFGKRASALTYYRAIRWLTGVRIEDSQADFRLLRARVLDALSDVRGDRVLRLLLPSVGFTSTSVTYDVQPRISGRSRFGFRRQIAIAANSAFGYSAKPLRLVASCGFVLSLLAMVWVAIVLITYMSDRTVAGWTSVMAAVLLVGGLTLLSLSVVGAYIARLYDILKGHPRYHIDRIDSCANEH